MDEITLSDLAICISSISEANNNKNVSDERAFEMINILVDKIESKLRHI